MNYNRLLIEKKLKEFLIEDCNFQDISSEFIPKGAQANAKIIAKSAGYISGLEELEILYDILGVSTEILKTDGDSLEKGDIITKLKGDARSILLGERTILNLIIHMSTITTTTRKFVKMIEDAGKRIKIACTRKTMPGLRIFEKKAAELGGADTHRYNLDDMVLLKDTHLRYYKGDIGKLLEDVKKRTSFSKKIELEIERVEDITKAVEGGTDIIMLDNMTPEQVQEAIDILRESNLREKVLIEVSGGIDLNNFSDYLNSEPDVISTSELTQSPLEKVDISLRFD